MQETKTTRLFSEAPVTMLLLSDRNTAPFSAERFSFLNDSSHHRSDRVETAGGRACTNTSQGTMSSFRTILATRVAGGVGASAQRHVSMGFISSQALLVDTQGLLLLLCQS